MGTGKTLYFEGAGMFGDRFGDVNNCRIRTAFTADDGTRYYLELLGYEWSSRQREFNKELLKEKGIYDSPRIAWVDFCHAITDEPATDDCNESRCDCERNIKAVFAWTLEGIRGFVNEALGCSFDAVAVADKFSGYRVFAKDRCEVAGDYNYGDEFVPNHDEEAMLAALEKRETERQRAAGEKWPCVSILRDSEDPDLVHVSHFGKQGLKGFDTRFSDGCKSRIAH